MITNGQQLKTLLDWAHESGVRLSQARANEGRLHAANADVCQQLHNERERTAALERDLAAEADNTVQLRKAGQHLAEQLGEKVQQLQHRDEALATANKNWAESEKARLALAADSQQRLDAYSKALTERELEVELLKGKQTELREALAKRDAAIERIVTYCRPGGLFYTEGSGWNLQEPKEAGANSMRWVGLLDLLCPDGFLPVGVTC